MKDIKPGYKTGYGIGAGIGEGHRDIGAGSGD